MLVYFEILEHCGQCLRSCPIKYFLYAEWNGYFSSVLYFPLSYMHLVVVVMSSFHKQAGLVCCWGTSGKPCSIIPTYLYLSSSKLEMFEILNLHLVIPVTFLANTEGMLLTSSHSILPCRNPFSATFQLVSNDAFLVGAQSVRHVNLPFTDLSLTWSLHLFQSANFPLPLSTRCLQRWCLVKPPGRAPSIFWPHWRPFRRMSESRSVASALL